MDISEPIYGNMKEAYYLNKFENVIFHFIA